MISNRHRITDPWIAIGFSCVIEANCIKSKWEKKYTTKSVVVFEFRPLSGSHFQPEILKKAQMKSWIANQLRDHFVKIELWVSIQCFTIASMQYNWFVSKKTKNILLKMVLKVSVVLQNSSLVAFQNSLHPRLTNDVLWSESYDGIWLILVYKKCLLKYQNLTYLIFVDFSKRPKWTQAVLQFNSSYVSHCLRPKWCCV